MGDLNAKVGKEGQNPTTGKFGLGEINERGRRLVDFCTENNLIITNTFYQHHPRNLYTWKSPGDIYRNQIDYIMIDQPHKNAVKNVISYPGADIGSDHNPVVTKIRLKLKRVASKQHSEQYDWNMLKNNEHKTRYNIEIKNKYNNLLVEENIQTIEEEREWNAIQGSLNYAVKEVLPVKERKRKQKWMTEEILQLMDES